MDRVSRPNPARPAAGGCCAGFASSALAGCLVALSLFTLMARAEAEGAAPDFASIDREVQGIKHELLEINRELSSLEEALLFTPEHQLVVFLSLADDTGIRPDLLRIELNGETVMQHAYSASEGEALRKGGVHKPYVGTVRRGDHRLQAYLRAKGKRNQSFELTTATTLTKGRGTKYVELRVEGSRFRRVPELTVHGW